MLPIKKGCIPRPPHIQDNPVEILVLKRTSHQVYLSLLDILLAYCYEIYATEGEKNVESPWNIRKLSATLCWLEYRTVENFTTVV
ncbi:UNVERIFIED_CONTAM: Hsp90 cochaperone shq1 [Gekko kuhli]